MTNPLTEFERPGSRNEPSAGSYQQRIACRRTQSRQRPAHGRRAQPQPLARPGHAIAKERLFELVFPGEQDVQPEAIEVVAYRLRKKIAHTGAQLVTLRGLGYLLKVAP